MSSTVAVALGFLNNDISLDAIVINANGASSVYSDSANAVNYGTFTAIGAQVLGNASNTSVAVGDIDDAQIIDVIVGSTTGSFVYINDGNGVMSLDATLTDTNTQVVEFVDIDLDVITANYAQTNRF